MTTRLRWTVSASASCFHCAARLAAGHMPVTPEIAVAVGEPTVAIAGFADAHGLPRAALFEQLVAAAAATESNREVAYKALTNVAGRGRAEPLVERLAGLVTACEQAYFRAFPQLLDELELRSRPLRELWEGRGPGLLAGVGRLTDRRGIVEEATVAVVQPFLGGDGAAHPPQNLVRIEAVLANPVERLPETVRLAWLLAQLNADLPDFTDALGAGLAHTVTALALLPAVLEAAADVELVRPGDPDLLPEAAAAWRIETPAGERTAEIIEHWWGTARGNSTRWEVKLKALETMFAEAGS